MCVYWENCVHVLYVHVHVSTLLGACISRHMKEGGRGGGGSGGKFSRNQVIGVRFIMQHLFFLLVYFFLGGKGVGTGKCLIGTRS